MRLALGSVKLGSLFSWPVVLTLATAIGLGVAATGCMVDGRDHHHDWDDDEVPNQPPQATEPKRMAIDTDETVTTDPGEGVGLFVEYADGGHWRVFTACDTKLSGMPCNFDVIVSVVNRKDELSGVKAQDLSGEGGIEIRTDGSARLITETTNGLDGMTFDTTPGAVVEIDTYLDGGPEPRFVYWVGDGVLHTGAPTNPVQLAPATPPAP